MRDKYKLVAQKQLEAEEKLVDLGKQLSRLLDGVSKAKAPKRRSSISTKRPPRKSESGSNQR